MCNNYQFTKGEVVLVRDNNTHYWVIAIFDKYNNDDSDTMNKYPYYILDGGHRIFYKQCIPYKGNEHLVNTTNDLLKEGDFVLVRDYDDQNWIIATFKEKNSSYNSYPYRVFYNVPNDTTGYKQCISYKGNEHLLNTNNNP